MVLPAASSTRASRAGELDRLQGSGRHAGGGLGGDGRSQAARLGGHDGDGHGGPRRAGGPGGGGEGWSGGGGEGRVALVWAVTFARRRPGSLGTTVTATLGRGEQAGRVVGVRDGVGVGVDVGVSVRQGVGVNVGVRTTAGNTVTAGLVARRLGFA